MALLLEDVSGPPGCSGACEHRREEVGRDLCEIEYDRRPGQQRGSDTFTKNDARFASGMRREQREAPEAHVVTE